MEDCEYSICCECRWSKYIAQSYDSPAEDWCEQESENYGTQDGCYHYEVKLDGKRKLNR